MAGTGGPGPPKNSPTVEPRITNTKYNPKIRDVRKSTSGGDLVFNNLVPNPSVYSPSRLRRVDIRPSRATWCIPNRLPNKESPMQSQEGSTNLTEWPWTWPCRAETKSVQIERGPGRGLSQGPPGPGWRPKIDDFRSPPKQKPPKTFRLR